MFDTVISTEMLEHDPHWRESVQRMIDLVKGQTPFGLGGTLIITCAAPGRGEHELACSPEPEYYREIGGTELADLVRSWFDRVRWWQMPPGNPGGCSPLPLAARDFRLIHTYWGWDAGRRRFAYCQSVWH